MWPFARDPPRRSVRATMSYFRIQTTRHVSGAKFFLLLLVLFGLLLMAMAGASLVRAVVLKNTGQMTIGQIISAGTSRGVRYMTVHFTPPGGPEVEFIENIRLSQAGFRGPKAGTAGYPLEFNAGAPVAVIYWADHPQEAMVDRADWTRFYQDSLGIFAFGLACCAGFGFFLLSGRAAVVGHRLGIQTRQGRGSRAGGHGSG